MFKVRTAFVFLGIKILFEESTSFQRFSPSEHFLKVIIFAQMLLGTRSLSGMLCKSKKLSYQQPINTIKFVNICKAVSQSVDSEINSSI